MDVTPQMLHEVEFRTKKVGGFDPDEVDDFLERVAVGVAELQQRLHDTERRAVVAESRVGAAEARAAELEARGQQASDVDEALRRTLVLAQRTADAAVREAEEQAARTVAAGQERASTMLREAEQKATQLVADAEAEATRGADQTRQRLVADIADLEDVRDRVRADITALESHMEEQRGRLRGVAADVGRLAEDAGALRPIPAPELSGASLPASMRRVEPPAAAVPLPEPVFEPDPLPEPLAEPVFEPDPLPEPVLEPVFEYEPAPLDEPTGIFDGAADGSPLVDLEARIDAESETGPSGDGADVDDDEERADEELTSVDAGDVFPASEPVAAFADRDEPDAWPTIDDLPPPVDDVDDVRDQPIRRGGLGLFGSVNDEFDGLPAEQHAVHIWGDEAVAAPDAEDDAYLAELRKAILDDDDDGESGETDNRIPDEGNHRFRSRFGRRR